MPEERPVVFNSDGKDWSAVRAAEWWCHEHGISVGAMQGPSPRALLRGDHDIPKWRNLTLEERKEVDGLMTGDMRNGPVKVELFKSSARTGSEAADA